MPVFINEVVFRSDIQKTALTRESSATPTSTENPEERARLIADITQAVMDKLEREFERMGER